MTISKFADNSMFELRAILIGFSVDPLDQELKT